MFNVDIDTGGTMTDGLVSGAQTFSVKVETTPHDLTISFLGVLEAASERLRYGSLREFLDQVDLIRWSSTITSNVLAQRTGPKLGLLVTAGHEDDLYGANGVAATVHGTLIDRNHIAGVGDAAGDEEVRRAVKSLFDQGIRRINVSLRGAFPDGSAENQIVGMIRAQYPDHFLGSVPALPAAELTARPDDTTRTFCSLINAYVHPSLASTLYRAEETVRGSHGWRGNVLVGHINGGVARIAKTTAFDTIESGPLFGTHACAWYASARGHDKVLALDVGGTTAKASAVDAGRVVFTDDGELFGIPLRMRLPALRSIALGGGSVARVETRDGAAGTVRLGPESVGAAPGPACYGLGGTRATLTDAMVILGMISPTSFLDGRRVLDTALASQAIDRDVATPLGVSTEQAARRVVAAATDAVAGLARATAADMGWQPGEATLYAFGGNGPLLATGVAERLGISTVALFGMGSVLSAFGSAISDVVHVYESAVADGADPVALAGQLRERAGRDLTAEGLDPGSARYEFEVTDAQGGAAHSADNPEHALAILGASAALVRLTASVTLPSIALADQKAGGGQPAPNGDRPLPAYDWTELAGAALTGPALVDGGSFTWLVDPGWSMSVDSHGDALLTKEGSR